MEALDDHLEVLASHVFDNDKLVIPTISSANVQYSRYILAALALDAHPPEYPKRA